MFNLRGLIEISLSDYKFVSAEMQKMADDINKIKRSSSPARIICIHGRLILSNR